MEGISLAAAEAWQWVATHGAQFVVNPLARGVGLGAIVILTISAIAGIYGGDAQRNEKGPFAFRPHLRSRSGFHGVSVQKSDDVPVQWDGMKADIDFYYIFDDSNGRRRRQKLFTAKNYTLNVQANKVEPVQNVAHGCEPVEGVLTEDIYMPPLNQPLQIPREVLPTPTLLTDFYIQEDVLKRWSGEDNLPLVTLPESLLDLIRIRRDTFIFRDSMRLRRARSGRMFWSGALRRHAADNRPSPLGNYYIKLRFPSDPYFVLFRHPDRDLKMTAWLTLLTSAFAMIMEAWPVHTPPQDQDGAARIEQTAPKPHTRVQNP
jgi:hypothetical protein